MKTVNNYYVQRDRVYMVANSGVFPLNFRPGMDTETLKIFIAVYKIGTLRNKGWLYRRYQSALLVAPARGKNAWYD